MTNVVMNTKAQSVPVAFIVLSIYMVSMVGAGYAIAANETVRMILTGHYYHYRHSNIINKKSKWVFLGA